MTAKNEAEKIIVRMIEKGVNLRGEAREIAIDMALREMEERGEE